MRKTRFNNKMKHKSIGKLLQIYRFVCHVNIRDMSKEIGIASSTLSRIENGKDMDGKTMIKIINWLFKGAKTHESI